MDSKQFDLFDSSYDGSTEIKAKKELKKREAARKAAETRKANKERKEKEALRQFEKEHPESFLFKEQKQYFDLLNRMNNIGK